ncbi:ribosome-associated ATPase/putative transporter RbbA [Brackiella oedipodis]|uniref:ribosome-associated ATPase/putative transporter RbbA n=1 Tax=Brackiella oedipodis TaxID=124225 RepID=UPI00048AC78E|nr:ribosome-associated ATPase/putative transporter RbbA [Brackiella oedipodis]
MNSNTSNAIEIEHLSHRFKKNQALKDVSFCLKAGSTAGLIGPDGVGKSTLLSIIAGVRIIQEGSVKVLDGDMRSKKVRNLNSKRIAFMPQGLGKNLYPTLSVKENIDFHARLFGLSKAQRQAKIDSLLRATGLDPFPDRPAGKLSGGMKQKLSLCCALVHDPELLILDEPTTGVDPLSRRQFWELVDSLRVDLPDMTVIVATAYIDEAEHFEYTLAMNDGELLAIDKTQHLIEAEQSATLEDAYIKLLPSLEGERFDFEHIPPFKTEPGSEPVIFAEHLTKTFGDFTAVNDVSFKIERGEIFGFLGSNGCGKSTTMKMLTGLLEPTSGHAELLGHSTVDGDVDTRLRVGYMSQNFSLYEELSVRKNLLLHARLYQLDPSKEKEIVEQSLEQFQLQEVADEKPNSLSLGIRQRLQLAAACQHKPEVLILDEPTSGVDPGARDMFWEHLIKLSRQQKITIFVSTHFMNEASWCDRISLMHQGNLLDIGSPEELRRKKHSETLEQAFIAYLEEVEHTDTPSAPAPTPSTPDNMSTDAKPAAEQATLAAAEFKTSIWSNIWTFAVRELKELIRDPIRLLFAFIGPITLVVTAAWGISFDINNVRIAVVDRDQSQLSHELIQQFSESPYFALTEKVHDETQIDEIMRRGKVRLLISIPEDFSKSLMQQQQPEVAFYVDGSIPFIAENIKGYVLGILSEYSISMAQRYGQDVSQASDLVSLRYIYNQEFRSILSIAPGMIMMALMLIPVVMTALGVVREREIGSITNLYASPAKVPEFLMGKQLPYIGLSFLSFLVLAWLAIMVLQVPIKGSFLAMAIGALCMACASTALGLLISCFVKSQIAAIFGSAIISLIPALNYSGLLFPTATLTGANYIVSLLFPSSWYQRISIGAFSKGLGFADFAHLYVILLAFAVFYVALACLFLKKQEA